MRDAEEDVDKIYIEVKKIQTTQVENLFTYGFSLQRDTFSALNYAKDFGTTVKESLTRTSNSKRAILTK